MLTEEQMDELLDAETDVPEWLKQADRVLESYAREASIVRTDFRALRSDLTAVREELAELRAYIVEIDKALDSLMSADSTK